MRRAGRTCRVGVGNPDGAAWFNRLDAELEKVRAALEWSETSGDTPGILDQASSCRRIQEARTRYRWPGRPSVRRLE